MRKLTLEDIQSKLATQGERIADAVNRFRINTEQQGWIMKRTRPRDPDEVKALNLLARRMLRNAMQEGTVRYDNERRVLSIAPYSSKIEPIEFLTRK